jgi:hypothetical protein
MLKYNGKLEFGFGLVLAFGRKMPGFWQWGSI